MAGDERVQADPGPTLTALNGVCEPGFGAVADALARNFSERGEIGAAVSVFSEGRKVVDLWAGHRDLTRTIAWQSDTLCIVYSVTKSMCALALHMLADRGLVDLDVPVAAYWPEFAVKGKERIRVRDSVSHHDGMCFVDSARPGDIFDPEAMLTALVDQEPPWPPATKGAYNSATFGYMVGEIVRRVDGRRVDTFLREEVADPLGAEFMIGVGVDDLPRLADIHPNDDNAMFNAGNTPGTSLSRAWRPMPERYGVKDLNSLDMRTGYLPSFGGHGTARGLARIYAALAQGGTVGGVRLLSPEAVKRASAQQWEEEADGTLGRPFRMAMGFMLNKPGYTPMGRNPAAFGHLGSGGALAFADPDTGISFAALTNYQCEGVGVGERTESLVESLYA